MIIQFVVVGAAVAGLLHHPGDQEVCVNSSALASHIHGHMQLVLECRKQQAALEGHMQAGRTGQMHR